MKIELELCNLKRQKISSVEEHWVELTDTRLVWYADFVASEQSSDDEEMPWKEDIRNCFCFTARKDAINGIEYGYSDLNKKWYVAVYPNGIATDPKFWFKTKTSAIELHNKILEWLNFN